MHGGGAGGQPAFGGGGGPKDPWEVSFFGPFFFQPNVFGPLEVSGGQGSFSFLIFLSTKSV